jgi:hypothetical protein
VWGEIIYFVELLVNREKVEFYVKMVKKRYIRKVLLVSTKAKGKVTYRFDEVNIRLPYKAVISLEDAFDATAALDNVPRDSPE